MPFGWSGDLFSAPEMALGHRDFLFSCFPMPFGWFGSLFSALEMAWGIGFSVFPFSLCPFAGLIAYFLLLR